MKTRILAILNLIALGFQLLMSFMVQLKLFSVGDVGQVSEKYDTVFAPAGLTFAIWGLIYLSLLGFTIFHLYQSFVKKSSYQTNQDTNHIGWLFFVNNIATGFWLLAWVNERLLVSVLLILIQLLTLIKINIKSQTSISEGSIKSMIFTHYPLSIYFAWICIATLANISAWLKSTGWNGFGISESYWVIILIALATLLTLFMVFVRSNIPFGLVVLWALYGIILKRKGVDPIIYEDVIYAAFTASALISVCLIVRIFKKQNLRSLSSL
ncbi:MAG: hypothetical protein FJY21_09495 [Bacteroidetes bacterium]|nr:hypothetical protein [Bacteroidota bacterium]